MADQRTDLSKPWHWPREWMHERAFWREVASRTVAGVLTILIIATPPFVYAIINGLVTKQQAFTIGFSVAIVALAFQIAYLVQDAIATYKKLAANGSRKRPTSFREAIKTSLLDSLPVSIRLNVVGIILAAAISLVILTANP